jgi:hypothetical protein
VACHFHCENYWLERKKLSIQPVFTKAFPKTKSGHFSENADKGNLTFEIWWQDAESNRGHKDFQSSALPTELSCQTIANIMFY